MATTASAPVPAAVPRQAPIRRRALPWVLLGVAIVVVSTVLVFWSRTRPSYDAYGWLVWGYQTLRLNLDLGGAPSWKPLPFLFTVPYALFGTHAELRLWMITAVSLALAGCVFGGRIAFFVVAGERDRALAGRQPAGAAGALARIAPWLAACFAGGAVLLLQDYIHYVLSVQSDPVIVSCVLAAIDFHLRGHRRLAFWAGSLAGLGRPEAWCLLVPYSVYLCVRFPRMRRMVVLGWALQLFMWFGVPTITNDRPFVSAQLAENSPRALRHDLVGGTLRRFWDLYDIPLWVAAAGTLAWAALRRNALVLTLGGAGLLWAVTEVLFALHGWPGLPRYMFEGAAILGVVGGIGFGWLLLAPAAAVGWSAHRAGASRAGAFQGEASRAGASRPRAGASRWGVLRWAAPVLAVALLVWVAPVAHGRYHYEQSDLAAQRVRTHELNWMMTTIDTLGGIRHLRSCGQPVITVEYASALAFYMHMDVGFVGYRILFEIVHRRKPIVLFNPLPNGWQVKSFHWPAGAPCRSLRYSVIFPPTHPGAQLIPIPL